MNLAARPLLAKLLQRPGGRWRTGRSFDGPDFVSREWIDCSLDRQPHSLGLTNTSIILGCRPQYGIILSLLSLSGDTKECPALLTTKKPASESFSASSSACWLSACFFTSCPKAPLPV